eukprot:CAMPEP_0182478830 /NCGR_PEP_ID=MMETSP1319-20130603/33117_1 /TAXON_ID=172717 /ORGANISM="Bolidomonas pacifica, Strain RCC208" /LENGTH=39 /DNA_ID= /DNA_START= /DNA_END= /DNA_ORIENTATION=
MTTSTSGSLGVSRALSEPPSTTLLSERPGLPPLEPEPCP